MYFLGKSAIFLLLIASEVLASKGETSTVCSEPRKVVILFLNSELKAVPRTTATAFVVLTSQDVFTFANVSILDHLLRVRRLIFTDKELPDASKSAALITILVP